MLFLLANELTIFGKADFHLSSLCIGSCHYLCFTTLTQIFYIHSHKLIMGYIELFIELTTKSAQCGLRAPRASRAHAATVTV